MSQQVELVMHRLEGPIPEAMPSRSPNESQLGQLIRWWLWVEGSKLRDLIARFRVSQPTVNRGMVVAGASREFVMNAAVEIGRVFGHTLEQDVLHDLSQSVPGSGRQWRHWAQVLKDRRLGYTESLPLTSPKNE